MVSLEQTVATPVCPPQPVLVIESDASQLEHDACRSLNAYCSAITSIRERVEEQSIGQHLLVSCLLKGAFNQNPPTLRYSYFWDVGLVSQFIRHLGENNALSLKWTSIKTAILMALTCPSRSADLSQLNIRL